MQGCSNLAATLLQLRIFIWVYTYVCTYLRNKYVATCVNLYALILYIHQIACNFDIHIYRSQGNQMVRYVASRYVYISFITL